MSSQNLVDSMLKVMNYVNDNQKKIITNRVLAILVGVTNNGQNDNTIKLDKYQNDVIVDDSRRLLKCLSIFHYIDNEECKCCFANICLSAFNKIKLFNSYSSPKFDNPLSKENIQLIKNIANIFSYINKKNQNNDEEKEIIADAIATMLDKGDYNNNVSLALLKQLFSIAISADFVGCGESFHDKIQDAIVEYKTIQSSGVQKTSIQQAQTMSSKLIDENQLKCDLGKRPHQQGADQQILLKGADQQILLKDAEQQVSENDDLHKKLKLN